MELKEENEAQEIQPLKTGIISATNEGSEPCGEKVSTLKGTKLALCLQKKTRCGKKKLFEKSKDCIYFRSTGPDFVYK